MMKRFLAMAFFSLTLVGLFIVLSLPALAQNPILQSGDTAKGLGQGAKDETFTECIKNGNCGAEHIFTLANNLIKWMVGIVGALALFMYVVGGLWMIFSAGSQTRVTKGKDILIGTTVALVFIMISWVIVSFVLTGLKTEDQFTLQGESCGTNKDCKLNFECFNKQCRSACYAQNKGEFECSDPGTLPTNPTCVSIPCSATGYKCCKLK